MTSSTEINTISCDAPSEDAITALRQEAGQAGDSDQVALCDRALEGDMDAIAECARVIADASALGDETIVDACNQSTPVIGCTCGAPWHGDERFDESDVILPSHKFAIDDMVEAGNTHSDYDTGTVTHVAGDQVTVAWSGLVETTQDASVLRPIGTSEPMADWDD